MYTMQTTPEFNRDVRNCKVQGRNMNLLWDTIRELLTNGSLPKSYSPHLLHGEYAGCWECHIEDDWLLVWKQNNKKLTMLFTNTGTHGDLFEHK